ncbi:alpha/beta fold hydrolase [Flavobacterium gawalongense]|uniref:Alpha/beta hydrolase n=1 Tax=Flavobacterium gawalongense TaxID=2594432 RepID=A0ABY3CNR2_9FLAO|nr:alpha/beta hydrolase [Flavobacterium gawalongense]TRX03706.1 alpha/beta hydrolase [Flavobacterium gawalongense]TRX08853.1 alpha/beta hydrolase [Flavobacterium gawalongense]
MENNALTTETQYATIDNKKIAYRKFGNGTPIILANRFRGTLDTWDPLFLDLLAETNTVITFDYSGIGYSEGELPLDLHLVAAEVVKIADYLKIDKFNVGGWSYGGLIAQYTTFLYPKRVLNTIVIGSNPMGKNETPLSPLFLEKALKPDYDLEDIITLFFEPKSEKSRIAAQVSSERIAKRIDQSKVPATPELFQRYFAPTNQLAEDKDNFRAAYKTLQTPVLVISGDNDISFAVENWFPLLQNAPTLQHIIFPNTGHAPHYQYPELATSYIKIFIKNTIN